MNKKDKKGGRKAKQIMDIVSNFEYPTDMYSPALQLTLPTLFNASRKTIYAHNMGHVVNIKNPDFPHIYTGFEKIYGSYSEMYEEADGTFEVLKKFRRNKYNYLLLVYDKKRNLYDVIERKPYEEFSEEYATKYNNKYLDDLEVGDKIKAGDVYRKSNSFNEENLHCIGKELNVLYTISTNTEEDCIELMNGAEHMMDNYKIYTVRVDIPKDSVALLNLYGDAKKKIYKPFPLIGEKTKNGILMSVRRVSSSSILHAGKDKNMDKIAQGDITKYVSGKIIDIVVHFNDDISSLPDSPTYRPIKELLKEQNDFYFDLHEELKEYVKKADAKECNCGDNLYFWMNNAYNFIDSSTFFSDDRDPIKDIKITFKVLEKNPLVPGSKLSGYFGNKGVVGLIRKKEESYYTESGKPVHIICDAFGITGRINIGQLFIVFANQISEAVIAKMYALQQDKDNPFALLELQKLASGEVVKIMSSKKLTEERFNILESYLKTLDSPDYYVIRDYWEDLGAREKEIFIEKVIRNGIYILQDPNEPTSVEAYEEAWSKFGGYRERIKFPDGTLSARTAIVNKLPFIRLKQDPIDKYSVRSKSNINPIKQTPAKSYNRKNFVEPYSDSAVRFGTYETAHLQICKSPEAISQLYALLSFSPDAKDKIADLYTRELDEDFLEEFSEIIHSGTRKNRECLEARLYQIGVRMEVEMDDGTLG